jgi:hypothetical protein
MEKRVALLPVSHKFASLSEETKSKYVHAKSFYSFGWSHGKEKLEGKPDYSKGSYYANPQYNAPFSDAAIIDKRKWSAIFFLSICGVYIFEAQSDDHLRLNDPLLSLRVALFYNFNQTLPSLTPTSGLLKSCPS